MVVENTRNSQMNKLLEVFIAVPVFKGLDSAPITVPASRALYQESGGKEPT